MEQPLSEHVEERVNHDVRSNLRLDQITKKRMWKYAQGWHVMTASTPLTSTSPTPSYGGLAAHLQLIIKKYASESFDERSVDMIFLLHEVECQFSRYEVTQVPVRHYLCPKDFIRNQNRNR